MEWEMKYGASIGNVHSAFQSASTSEQRTSFWFFLFMSRMEICLKITGQINNTIIVQTQNVSPSHVYYYSPSSGLSVLLPVFNNGCMNVPLDYVPDIITNDWATQYMTRGTKTQFTILWLRVSYAVEFSHLESCKWDALEIALLAVISSCQAGGDRH